MPHGAVRRRPPRPRENPQTNDSFQGREVPCGDQLRPIARRTRLHDPGPTLFCAYRYLDVITDFEGDAVGDDVDHDRHAVVELAIRGIKEG